jgi:hypothetical protein
MSNKSLCARLTILATATLLLSAGVARVAGVSPVVASAQECATRSLHEPSPDDATHDHVTANCFTAAELAALDASGATLAANEVGESRNVQLVANLPKEGDFAPAAALNSDLAFAHGFAFAGNYNGFVVYDVRTPGQPHKVAQVLCPGSQNDVSIYENLLILSTDSSRTDSGCASTTQSAAIKESWEGLKIFDISDPAHPVYVTSVETDCGSHTHTTIPDPQHQRAIVYVQSYSPSADFPDCQPPHDYISVVEVKASAPEQARVLDKPLLFPDGGFPGIPGQTSATSGCHDITAYPARGLAAGACMGQGVLLDIRNPASPKVIDSVTAPNFAFWHSATFNDSATTVVFTDELGGGGAPTCNPTIGPNRGADAIYRIVDTPEGKRLQFASNYKISRTNTNTENCVAHNGSLIPVRGRDIMVQAWYQGGISVMDFTDAAHPQEIGWFDRGPLSETTLTTAGSWSAYWYNGLIYSNEIQRGLDVIRLVDPRTIPALRVRQDVLNVQTQTPLLQTPPLH